jgi:hypothetical protein
MNSIISILLILSILSNLSNTHISLDSPFLIHFLLIFIPSAVISFIIEFYLERKKIDEKLPDQFVYFLWCILAVLFTLLIYELDIIFKFSLSVIYIISGGMLVINFAIIFIFSNYHILGLYPYSLGKKIKIDNCWHYNGHLRSFLLLSMGLIIMTIVLYLIASVVGLHSAIMEFIVFSLAFIIIWILFSNHLWYPIKYKFSKSKIEFKWTKERTEKYKMDDEALELIMSYNLKLPKKYKKSLLFKNPKTIKLKNIYSFRLNKIEDEVLNIFVMKNGIIYTLEPLLINYLDQLFKILPLNKMIQDVVVDVDSNLETTSYLVKKPKPPKFLREYHPLKR